MTDSLCMERNHKMDPLTQAYHQTSGRRRRLTRAARWLLPAIALMLVGCREGGPGARVFVRQDSLSRPRLAVLPFTSPAEAAGAGDVVTGTVLTYLLSTGAADVVEPGLVDKAMRSARFVPQASGGLDSDTLAALQQQLHVDAYMLGQVEEYGEIRVGPDTYPSVSFSARIVRASDNSIVWAASISRTGADSVRIFDIGRVSSLGKLTKAAVAEMADSLQRNWPDLASSAVTQQLLITPTSAPGLGPAIAVTVNPALSDETSTYGTADLKALLAEAQGFSRGEVTYAKHFHDTVTTQYRIDGRVIEVKLVDYLKVASAGQFVAQQSPGLAVSKLGSLNAFAGSTPEAAPGGYHLNLAAGRFGLYLTGPANAVDEMHRLASALIAVR